MMIRMRTQPASSVPPQPSLRLQVTSSQVYGQTSLNCTTSSYILFWHPLCAVFLRKSSFYHEGTLHTTGVSNSPSVSHGVFASKVQLSSPLLTARCHPSLFLNLLIQSLMVGYVSSSHFAPMCMPRTKCAEKATIISASVRLSPYI